MFFRKTTSHYFPHNTHTLSKIVFKISKCRLFVKTTIASMFTAQLSKKKSKEIKMSFPERLKIIAYDDGAFL